MEESSRRGFCGLGLGGRRGVRSATAFPLFITSGVLLLACGSRELEQSQPESPPSEPIGTARAALVTATVLNAVGDTFVRSGIPNQNEGSTPRLSVQIGSTHRSLLYFDTAAIRAAALGQTLLSAQVELTIRVTAADWGPGRLIAIHPMRQASTEGRATWSCASDSIIGNQTANCSGATAWNMAAANATLPFALQPTATSLINNNQTGLVSFDVTSDVSAIVAGTDAGLGWIVKKVNETLAGTMDFASREVGPAPRLRLQLETISTCTPTAQADELCDGVDEDCSGAADEDFVPVATSCGVGACGATGATSCVEGQVTNSCQPGLPASADTTCDGLDEDCSGAADEDFVAVATSCGVGVCGASGATSCVGGQVTNSCQPGVPASLDASCDGLDEDCDGAVDEDYASLQTSCGVGACGASGATSCVGGQVTDSCQPGVPASVDATCNGLDEDCSGAADEDFVPVATSCGVGVCGASGATSCVEGQGIDSCQPGAPASLDASCDGLDEDCDGVVDEDYASLPTSCGVGACGATGATSCVLGEALDSCEPGLPAASDTTCDAVDDDCDALADEDYVALETSCGTGACSSSGATSCAGGSVVDSCAPGSPAPVDASCDGVDDDCDGSVDEEFVLTCVGTSARSCVGGAFHDVECSDANACNGGETCSGLAECQPGVPPELDDGDPCTVNGCEPAVGVVHPLVAAGTACGAYRECNSSGQCLSLLPPDPADVAPPLPASSVSLLESVRFIFEGPAPIQTQVAPGTLQTRSAALLRGRLLDEAGQPLPGAVVRVHDHPELGQTLTRFDGEYDLVVNGGRLLTLEFSHTGYIGAQRTLGVPWQDYAFVDDLKLLPPDLASSELEFPAITAQVHSGVTSEDARGVRTATLYVPSGTDAELVLPDGSSVSTPSLTIRVTEFSVGPDGALAIPAELVQTAAFSYSVELSSDEAMAVNADRVELSQPAALYVENFLDFPVGSELPIAAYDRDSAAWIGIDNGRIIEILGVVSGRAELDVDGSGSAASSAALSALGISVEESQALAELYLPGEAFWRARVQHLAPFDFSLPYHTDRGVGGTVAAAPTSPTAQASQVLAASLPVSGTPFTLRYRSDRVPGYRLGQIIDVPTTGTSASSTLLGSVVDIQVAGQRRAFTSGPSAGQLTRFIWDGTDGEGRAVQGERHAQIRVGWMFPRVYVAASDSQSSYGHFSPTGDLLGSEQDVDIRWLTYQRNLRRFDGRELGLGAWSLDKQHRLDPVGRVLYRGDGTLSTLGSSLIIDRFAGIAGGDTDVGDGGPALAARLSGVTSLAVGPDGALYIGTRLGIRRVDPGTGVITTVAGGEDASRCNATLENGPALDVCLFPRKLDFGRDGALYISDNPTGSGTIDRIRRLDLTTGLISQVAGGPGSCTSSGPAEHARICNLISHASSPDGSIYLLDRGTATGTRALRKISPNGIIETIGTGDWPVNDDSADIAVGPDSSLYVTQFRGIQRILPTGEVQRFAGDAAGVGSTGEGGLATLARFGNGGPNGVMVGADGRVYVGDNGNGQVRVVDQLGIIRRLVGTTANIANGDGGSPLLANLGTGVLRTALAPDGTLYLSSRSNNTVRVVRPTVRGNFAGEMRVASDDGTETYRFDANGRHLDTVQTATGNVLLSFAYDAAGRLSSVSSAGQATLIQRDAAGRPTGLLAPSGQLTQLDTDQNGYLSQVIDPSGNETDLGYDLGGLLMNRADTSGASQYAYDADGRLIAQ